jgi:NAD(P)H dehydrogenase (quinone)
MDRNKEPLSVFVIGGSGSIGKALLACLQPDSAAGTLRVRAASRSNASAEFVHKLGAEPVHFDLDDRLALPARHVDALKSTDVLFLLTGYSVDMIAQSKAVIDASLEAGVKHVVHLGLMARTDTRGIHQGWHQMIEAYLERTGMGWTHLHPNMFMTSFRAMQLQNNVYPIAPTGRVNFKGYLEPDVKVSWIAVDDIAEAAATVLRDPDRHHQKAYELAVECRTFAELTQLAGKLLGRDFGYETVPVDVLRNSLLENGMEAKYAESAVHTMIMANTGLLPEFGDVHDDYQHLTGKPPTRWRDMIMHHPEWFGIDAPSRPGGVVATALF